MKHTKEEILNALHIIKETCEEYDVENERECPFYGGKSGECAVMCTQPELWHINDDVEAWKGLL